MSTISTQPYFHTADSISFLLECICISIISLQRGLARELKKAKTSIRLMFRRGDSYRLQFHMAILLYRTFVYTPIALVYLSFNNNLWCLCLRARALAHVYFVHSFSTFFTFSLTVFFKCLFNFINLCHSKKNSHAAMWPIYV